MGTSRGIDLDMTLDGEGAMSPRNYARPGSSGREAWMVRVLDVLIAGGVLVFLAPIMLVVCLLVKLQDGGPVLFSHRRIGMDGRPFGCLKFRSMVLDSEARLQALLASDPAAREDWARDHKLKRDPRVTAIGRFLRKSSLDELPQLINVLRGEMSVVGPRPIVEAEISRYGRRFASYCGVRPGITGLWQISGRNDTSYRRRIALDHVYAQRLSLRLYLHVLLLTLPAVFLQKGSY